jgi:hypothetical protein
MIVGAIGALVFNFMNIDNDVYYEKVVFLSESIGCEYSEGLCINITREDNGNGTFYFDGEFKLKNYSYGECLRIRWGYIKQIEDYRIRGVWRC